MKHNILLASTLAFAAQATAALSSADHALVLSNVHLAGEGHLAGMLSVDPAHSLNGPGALISIDVLEGGIKSVTGKLEALIAENPYVRPLKLLASVTPAADKDAPAPAAEDGAKPAKKAAKAPAKPRFESNVIIIVGTFQP